MGNVFLVWKVWDEEPDEYCNRGVQLLGIFSTEEKAEEFIRDLPFAFVPKRDEKIYIEEEAVQ